MKTALKTDKPVIPKPVMYRCASSRLWRCVYDEVEGCGTTRRHAYVQWRTLYRKIRFS